MHPPRLTPISKTLISHQSLSFSIHHAYLSIRLLSTAASPSLIKTHNIPAPHTGHIRVLSLNSPHNRNAISRHLLTELSHEINTVKTEAEDEASKGEAIGQGTRVLILASAIDNCFCAGADLKERKGMDKAQTNTFLHNLRTTLNTLESLPIPTIAAVSSVALGGGLELALATTLRVFASTATVGLPETRLGIIPGAGGTYRLKRLIGEAQALELILSGRRINGREASELGICQRVQDTDQIPTEAEKREDTLGAAVELAQEICQGGPAAVGAALRAVKGGSEEVEGREYEGVVGTGDRDGALKAFGEKRKPVFRGR